MNKENNINRLISFSKTSNWILKICVRGCNITYMNNQIADNVQHFAIVFFFPSRYHLIKIYCLSKSFCSFVEHNVEHKLSKSPNLRSCQ